MKESKMNPKGTLKSVKKSAKAEKKSSAATESSAKPEKKSLAAIKASAKAKKKTSATPKSNPKTVRKLAKGDKKFAKDPGEAKPVKLVSPKVANQMLDKLCALYPHANCELDFEDPYQLLTAVILSAQTTDSQVNKVTPTLFKRFPTAKHLLEGSLEEIKEIIRPTGYYNAKAQNIQRCAQALVEQFGGYVPRTLEELTKLPGVGRKTANVVLGVAYGVPGWTVDTHVQRLSLRLGLSGNTDPYKIELDLQKLFPSRDWSKLSITLIWHGRRLCYARKPDCAKCPINHLCPSSLV